MKLPFERKPDLSRCIDHLKRPLIWLGIASVLIAAIDPSAKAATLQVKPGGAAGTYSTIGAAVLRAQADYTDNGTVDVIEDRQG